MFVARKKELKKLNSLLIRKKSSFLDTIFG